MASIGKGAVSGQVNRSVVNVTGVTSYSAAVTDEFIQVTTGGTDTNVTLPTSVPTGSLGAGGVASTTGDVGTVGLRITVQKIDSGGGKVNVLGKLNVGLGYALASKWSSAAFVNDGVNWNLVAVVS